MEMNTRIAFVGKYLIGASTFLLSLALMPKSIYGIFGALMITGAVIQSMQ
jgi:hypothetical protein